MTPATIKFRKVDSATPTVIFEEDDSQINYSEEEEIENEVIDFMKQTKSKMQQDQLMGKSSMHYEIMIPKKVASSGKKIRTVKKDDPFTFDKVNPDSHLKMKGIIGGVSNKKIQNERNKKNKMKAMSRGGSRRKLATVTPIDFEKDLDIDEVIPPEH